MAPGRRARRPSGTAPPCRPGRGPGDPLPRRRRSATPAARSCSTGSTSRSRPARRWPSSARTAPARRRWPSCCAGCYDPVGGVGRGRRHRPARARPRRLASARHRGVPGLRALRAAAARQRGARRRRPTPTSLAAARRRRRRRGRRPRHAARQGLPRRHRPVRRAVAARRPGPGPAAVRAGAGVVLLDEPTAQLDVRGEAEIFERILDRHARAARRSSSRTASRPCARPTASACSSTARSSSSAPTTS